MGDWKQEMKDELSEWRSDLEQMRVKASLAKLELREKREQALRDFDHAYGRASRRLGELKQSAATEWDASTEALEAGWETLRKVYKEVKQRHSSEA